MADHHPERYRRISNEDRQRLITAFQENDVDYLELADRLGIKRQTARSIVSTFLQTGRTFKLPRGGNRNAKIDNDMRDRLRASLNADPLATLVQLKADLEASLPNKPRIATSTIARTLDGMLYTSKLAQDIPRQRNAQRVVDNRAEYAQWFMEEAALGRPVFIDECGYNVWTRRTYGRAPRGQPARRVVSGQRGRNLNVTIAIAPGAGLVHHRMAQETVTREGFEGFLSDTAQRCRELFEDDDQVYIIYDNARPHINARLPEGMDNITLKLLPPYSPFLNPVENAHSAFKAQVKKLMARPEWQRRVDDREAAREEGINLQQMRLNLLLQIGQLSIGVITPEKCVQWCQHSQTFFPRCLARQPIDG